MSKNDQTKEVTESQTNIDLPQYLNLFKVDAVLKIQVQKGLFHIVKYPTRDNLKALELKYPEEITYQKGGSVKTPNKANPRNLYLWELVIDHVEGYPDKKDWRESVPIMHKLPVANEVTRVWATDRDYIRDKFGGDILKTIDPALGCQVVYIVARQAGVELPVIHVFKPVTENHLAIYDRAVSFDQTQNKNRMFMKSNPRVDSLCDLYNDLIAEVHGCTDDDNTAPAAIGPKVPPLHQVVAVTAYFTDMTELVENFSKN